VRHRVKGKKLSRTSSQRKALFKGLINALVIHGEIKTTESKAKAVRGLVDKLINKGKKGTLHSRRLIAAFLQNKLAVNRIVDELGPLFAKRSGGFSRIVRLGARRGDNAMMVKLELVEKPAKAKIKEKDEKKTSSDKTSQTEEVKTKEKKTKK
jgi:large subunit ribosomal protein L17